MAGREIGNLLPNNQRQRRTCYALCHILYPVSAAHTSIFRSNSTSYHGRYEMAKALVELGAPFALHSTPCGRGAHGTPIELARGGGHTRIVALLEEAALKAEGGKAPRETALPEVPPRPLLRGSAASHSFFFLLLLSRLELSDTQSL